MVKRLAAIVSNSNTSQERSPAFVKNGNWMVETSAEIRRITLTTPMLQRRAVPFQYFVFISF
jgi:hypothetical protein